MDGTPESPLQPQQFTPTQSQTFPAKPQKPKRARMVVLFVAIILLWAAAGCLYWQKHNHSSQVSSRPSLTIYYNDGKSVLWKTGDSTTNNNAPAFVSYVRAQLRSMYGNKYTNQGQWAVTTTLNKTLQGVAKDEVQEHKATLTSNGANDSSFIAENVTNGQVVSWVGGITSLRGAYDGLIGTGLSGISTSELPIYVGSLQLPFTYASYLENTSGSVNTILDDAQGPLPGWPCTDKSVPSSSSETGNCLWDEDHEYLGPMTLSQALSEGRNVPAVEAANDIDDANATNMVDYNPNVSLSINKIIATSNAMGSDGACYQPSTTILTFTKQEQTQCGLAAAIGDAFFATPTSLLEAYATLANSGGRLPQAVILKTSLNGKTDYEWRQTKTVQAIHKDTALALTNALSDTNTSSLQADKSMFITRDGTQTAISYGGNSNFTTGDVQYSSKYAAELWVEGQQYVNQPDVADGGYYANTLNSSIGDVMMPVTYGWMNTVE